MSTWEDLQFKEGGAAQSWADADVDWADPLYEWDGQTASTWTDTPKN